VAVEERRLTRPKGEPAERLDRLLAAAFPDLTRSRVQALIRAGRASIDGARASDPALKVAGGATLTLAVPPPEPARPAPEAIALAVVYEDDDLIVIDKPAGLVVHPAAGHESGTLVNALLAHCGDSLSGIGGVRRPGIVHRLDKDTSGLMVVAKTDAAHQALAAQFADHGRSGPLERAYLALAWGGLARPALTIEAALARSARNREKIAVVPQAQGRRAVTHVETQRRFPAERPALVSLLRCRLETGRTHQIRVHLAHVGHPLLGDAVYGAGFRTKEARLPPPAREALTSLGRQALHAALLGFAHPRDGRPLRFESPVPADLQQLIDALPA
jgi:23S rRNA pseudouridine1911/1915/1917 synthase